MKSRRRALVMQGGGALGAYAYGVIRALYEQPDFSLDVVTGVSIGATNAAVLVGAKDDPIEPLDELRSIYYAYLYHLHTISNRRCSLGRCPWPTGLSRSWLDTTVRDKRSQRP